MLFTPAYVFTVPGLILSLLGAIAMATALLVSPGSIDAWPHWPAVFIGPILIIVGLNALLLGLAAHMVAVGKGITNESRLLRLYRRNLSLEGLLAAAAVLVAGGIGVYAFLGLAPDLESPLLEAQVGALAQCLTVVGLNVVLAAFLLGLLKTE
jgi:hypothetical protein